MSFALRTSRTLVRTLYFRQWLQRIVLHRSISEKICCRVFAKSIITTAKARVSKLVLVTFTCKTIVVNVRVVETTTKVIWQNATSLGTAHSCVVDILYHIGQVAERVAKLVLTFGGALGPHFGERGSRRQSAMVPFERAMMVSYRLGSPLWPLHYLEPFGGNVPSSVSDAQIKGQNLDGEWSTDVSQNLTQPGRILIYRLTIFRYRTLSMKIYFHI